ncbi:hypothetical protein [Syntrophotalea acetylenica]|uniref:hypothetical protein n=1 Tax=Syntrophotalea acetylenica TaxID=29542 RepID=UPI002A36917A|nr:hypothetical protein [Syntrophotalea acetylenica]MDY0261971.1 hypothetical protein [Syntrophotalea acetylenica]
MPDLLFLAASQPVYSAPPGDALTFGYEPDGGRLLFAFRSVVYVPPSGDGIVFGAPGPPADDGPLELAAVIDLGIGAAAELRTVHLLSATLDLALQSSASIGGVIAVSAVIDLDVTSQAAAMLVTPLAVTIDMPLTATAATAPSWYVPAPFGGSYRARWTDGARTEHRTGHPHRQAPTLEPRTHLPWGAQQPTQQAVRQPWKTIPDRNRQTVTPWADLQNRPYHAAGMPYAHPAAQNRERIEIPWGGVLSQSMVQMVAGYCYPATNDNARIVLWDILQDLARGNSARYGAPPAKDIFVPIISGPNWYPRWCINRYDPPRGDQLLFDAGSGYLVPAGDALLFADLSSNYPRHCFDGTWTGPKDPYWYKPRSWNIARPNIRRVYYVMNTVSLIRLADSVPIPVESLQIGTDRDSWAWSLSATLVRKTDLDLVRPSGGAPVEVEATINDLSWRFAIEEYGEEVRWGHRAYTATGRSLSAYLADPYSAPRDLIQTQQRTAQQLAEDELTDTGFSVVWGLPEWLVPGGVWSYQGQTPIQAIAQIAAAAGGVVQSHPSNQQLLIQPWYKAMPWSWGGVAIDAVVPAAMIDSRRGRFEPRPAYTGVYCRGQQQGVTCFVRRTGTDGSRLAGQQVHSLITAVEPGLALGKKILADSGARSIETLNLPLLDNPGLLAPGSLIEIQDTETWRGQVIRTNIVAQRPAVNQTVDVLRYHGS